MNFLFIKAEESLSIIDVEYELLNVVEARDFFFFGHNLASLFVIAHILVVVMMLLFFIFTWFFRIILVNSAIYRFSSWFAFIRFLYLYLWRYFFFFRLFLNVKINTRFFYWVLSLTLLYFLIILCSNILITLGCSKLIWHNHYIGGATSIKRVAMHMGI